jgi:hypothetical protein
MEVSLNLTPLDLLISIEARMALYRLHIPKQTSDPKAEAGLLSNRKIMGDPLLDVRSDYTFPVYHKSKIIKVVIDRD